MTDKADDWKAWHSRAVLGDKAQPIESELGKLVSELLEPNERAAREIVAQGAQILLPYDAGDAEVRFSSRRHLVALIMEVWTDAYLTGAESPKNGCC